LFNTHESEVGEV